MTTDVRLLLGYCHLPAFAKCRRCHFELLMHLEKYENTIARYGFEVTCVRVCDQTLSPPNTERWLAESPLSFRRSFGKRVVGRVLRARRFGPTMLTEHPEVVPYHTLPKISAKEEGFGPELSHKGADNVWSHRVPRCLLPSPSFCGILPTPTVFARRRRGGEHPPQGGDAYPRNINHV